MADPKRTSVYLLFTLSALNILTNSLSDECASIVPQQDIDFFAENGYLLIHNILNSDLSEIQTHFDLLFNRRISEGDELEGRWQIHGYNNSHKSLLSIHDWEWHDSIFMKKVLFNLKIGCYTEVGSNSNNVILHHTKAHLKPYKIGTSFPAHQDYHYFPFKNHTMTAIFIHLDDTNKENGGLIIYPGSHKLGPLTDVNVDYHSGYHYIDPNDIPNNIQAIDVNVKAGDAAMFSYLTVHASYPNLSDDSQRRMMLLQFHAADDVPEKRIHRRNKGQGMVLRGYNPYQTQWSHYKNKLEEFKVLNKEKKEL